MKEFYHFQTIFAGLTFLHFYAILNHQVVSGNLSARLLTPRFQWVFFFYSKLCVFPLLKYAITQTRNSQATFQSTIRLPQRGNRIVLKPALLFDKLRDHARFGFQTTLKDSCLGVSRGNKRLLSHILRSKNSFGRCCSRKQVFL